MPIIIACKKAWAAHVYISHFGKKLSPEPVPQNLPVGTYFFPNEYRVVNIGLNEYLVSHNQFYFKITKNKTIDWQCGKEPSPEFDELVNVSLPLWEKYISGNNIYNS